MLSVLIFTYERHDYLKVAIRYWEKLDVIVIIADASENPYQEDLPSNIQYLHMPNQTATNRLFEMAKYVKTPYVVLCADDDYLAEHGLITLTTFLNKNPDYAAVQGAYIRFWISSLTNSFKWLFDYLYALEFKFLQEEKKQRFWNATQPPIMHYCYSVMRLDALMRSLNLLKDVEPEMGTSFELGFIAGIMYSGKYATLPVLFSARQSHNKSYASLASTYCDWYKNNAEMGFKKWRKNIITLYSDKQSTESIENFTSMLDETLENYYRSINVSVKPKLIKNENALKARLKATLRPSFHLIKKLYNLYSVLGVSIIGYLHFHKDLSKIKRSVLENIEIRKF